MITIPQLRKMVEAAALKSKEDVTAFQSDRNPQIVELAVRAEAQRSAFQAVLDAINNDRVMLKIMGGC